MPAKDDERCYHVYWRGGHGVGRRPAGLPSYYPDRFDSDYDDRIEYVVFGRIKGSKIMPRATDMLIPPNAKVVKVNDPGDFCTCDDDAGSSPPALRPGNHADLQLNLYKTSAELRVFNDGVEAAVDGRRSTPRAALIRLVRDYGLREKQARAVLKEAERKHGLKCRIKLAQPLDTGPIMPPFPEPQPGTDPFMGSQYPGMMPMEMEMPVPNLGGPEMPPMGAPPDPMVAQQLMQAAQTGQKEVFDASMVSNMLRTSQNETLIDRHLPNLMKGLDSLARLIFNLYWHREDFEDVFGENNLTDIEDGMVNAFETLGDITLELKQKAIEVDPGATLGDLDAGA
jgi:hypothetical protein